MMLRSPPHGFCALCVLFMGCSGIERTQAPPRQTRIGPTGSLSVPQVMRGTVAADTILQGYQPLLVHGHGLVVGLNGTGARDLPPAVRAHMLATATRHGIGSERTGWSRLSPTALLNSPDTAVVVVQGVIPPASPKGTRFDVRVLAYPTSSTTSLEGGRLYTANLHPMSGPDGQIQALPPTGSRQAAPVAAARGVVFLNPFAQPGGTDSDTVNRRSGRILAGGVVTRDMPLRLRLVMPSHARASILQDAINTRFPQEPGQRSPTARGESDESIQIIVPPSYHDRTREFAELLRHMTIRQTDPQRVAMTIRRHVVENPSSAAHASWRWRALGPRVLPIIRDLYDHPAQMPRLAALRAGAHLDDPLVTRHLIDMAQSASATVRHEAIDLLAGMGIDPQINRALRDLLNDEDIETRLASYEALAQRGDPAITRFTVDDKFIVDVVESDKPLVYITQMGRPRLTIFGRDLAISRPVTLSTWSQRFMIKGDLQEKTVEVYYRAEDADRGVIHRTEPQLASFVQFLGQETAPPQPRAGLDLSYGQVVGVLHQIWRQGYLEADFRAEQDRILAAMLRQRPERRIGERPEFGEDEAHRPPTLQGQDTRPLSTVDPLLIPPEVAP
ncbi:MAG: flagellar basal body P-ring protein FlgI [Planctomycetes bacterium]|nr:flagellar basal body P-ring protein FlgI [Planctomycetota bacterium]